MDEPAHLAKDEIRRLRPVRKDKPDGSINAQRTSHSEASRHAEQLKMNIKTGDFIVTKSRWMRTEVHEVTKVTSKLVFYHEENYNRPFRVRLEDVVFSG